MKNILITLVMILFSSIIIAQNITFLSENTHKPLTKISVFGNDGNILAYSDIDGKIERKALNKDQENFQLVYENYPLATLSYTDFNQEIILLNDKVKEIEPIIIKNTKPAKFIFIKGNFNAYVTLNNKLNCYADGIVTYVFDNKTKKLKSTNVEQYRIYRLIDAKNEKKETETWDYKSFLDIPKIKNIGNIEGLKNKNTKIKELKGATKDEIEISGEALLDKEFALFGYRFFDLKNIINISFEKDSKKALRDFVEYNQISFVKLKHKTEANFNQTISYKNFYPTDVDYSNENDKEKIKFNKEVSNYKEKYWQKESFPNMQPIFQRFFKEDLKENENRK